MLIRTTMVLSALVFVLTPSSDIHARIWRLQRRTQFQRRWKPQFQQRQFRWISLQRIQRLPLWELECRGTQPQLLRLPFHKRRIGLSRLGRHKLL